MEAAEGFEHLLIDVPADFQKVLRSGEPVAFKAYNPEGRNLSCMISTGEIFGTCILTGITADDSDRFMEAYEVSGLAPTKENFKKIAEWLFPGG
jgi:hypothetical protein